MEIEQIYDFKGLENGQIKFENFPRFLGCIPTLLALGGLTYNKAGITPKFSHVLLACYGATQNSSMLAEPRCSTKH